MSSFVPDGWSLKTISEVCNIAIGGTPSRSVAEYWDTEKTSDNLWVSIRDLNKSWIYETSEHITDLGVKSSNVKLVKKGTVLMSFKLSVGRVAYAGKDLYTNEAIVAFLPKSKDLLSNQYLYQGLQQWNLLENIDQAVKGITLNKEKINQIEALLPPLPEQQKIATILSSVDDVIEKTRAQIDKLKDLKTAMMQQLLTQGIGHTEFKDSPVGRIPKTWKVFTIEDILESIIDYRGKSPPKSEVGIPLITAKNIRQGYIDVNPKEYIYEEQYNSWMVRGFPVEGDVFITTEAPLGNVARVPTYKFAIGQRVLTLRPKEFVATDYLFYMMQGQYFREQLDLESTGSTVAGIKQSTFRNILVPLPSKAEQLEIAKPLNALNRQIDVVQEKLKSMETMKKALMQDLLTGKVRVNDDTLNYSH